MSSLALWSLILAAASAAGAGPPKPDYVRIDPPKPVTVARGRSGELVVALRVKEGFHVQANPASQPQLIATTLETAAPDGITAGEPLYPPGKPYRLQGAPMEIASYEGTVELRLPLTAAATAKKGKRKLEGKVRYQACNATTCFPPAREPFSADIVVK